MAGFDIRLDMDVRQITRNLNRIQKKEIPKATNRALNRTLNNVVSEITGALARPMATTKRAIRGVMAIKKSSFRRLVASAAVTHKAINLMDFKGRRIKSGISAAEWGKRRQYKGVFTLGDEAWVRKGKPRLPIRPVWGPSVTQVWERIDLTDKLNRIVNEKFPQHFATDLSARLRRFGRKR